MYLKLFVICMCVKIKHVVEMLTDVVLADSILVGLSGCLQDQQVMHLCK